MIVSPGEALPFALACAWAFTALAAMYVVMPVRGAFLFTNYGPEVVPWVYMASAATTGVAVWVFNRFAFARRARLVGGTLAVLSATLLGWWCVAERAATVAWASFAFSLWTDVFSIMSVTVFWSYMNDVFRGERATRWFGLIAASASLGGIAGSFAVKSLVTAVGTFPLLLAGAVLCASTLAALAGLERWAGTWEQVPEAGGRVERRADALKAIRASRLLQLITALVVLERLVPDVSNYLFTVEMARAYPRREELAAAFAAFSQWTNLAAFAAGLTLSTWMLRAGGPRWGLLSASLPNLAGLALYGAAPSFEVAVGFNGLEGTFRYTVFKSAKEASYTAAPREVLYPVKAFVEMFLYRFARGLAGFVLLLLTAQRFGGLGAPATGLACLPLAGAWVWVAWSLGREFERLRAGEDSPRG